MVDALIAVVVVVVVDCIAAVAVVVLVAGIAAAVAVDIVDVVVTVVVVVVDRAAVVVFAAFCVLLNYSNNPICVVLCRIQLLGIFSMHFSEQFRF